MIDKGWAVCSALFYLWGCFLAQQFDVVIIGGGAAGMMCAAQAGQRGRKVFLIEHGKALGEKIRISGGGRCNFTNVHASPKNFLSENKHFCISALKRYSAADFIQLVEAYGIAYHEKTLGQLFCDHSAQDIISLLKSQMEMGGVEVALGCQVSEISKTESGFSLGVLGFQTEQVQTSSLVIASGGKSIPKMGASGFGYKVAEQFGINVIAPRPGLVPLTFDEKLLAQTKGFSGTGVESRVRFGDVSFDEALLFTHRGLSGPAILQISSYWQEGKPISISLLPEKDLKTWIEEQRREAGKREVVTVLVELLSKRVVQMVLENCGVSGRVADLSKQDLGRLEEALQNWSLLPVGTEGYRTAEVTVGGVDTDELSSKTMMAKQVPGLFFIGEVVDVTGWLGGYNFQWAWSSGWVAGQEV